MNKEKLLDLDKRRTRWLQSLSEKEKAVIIEFDIYTCRCKKETVTDLLTEAFGFDLILEVWRKVKKEGSE